MSTISVKEGIFAEHRPPNRTLPETSGSECDPPMAPPQAAISRAPSSGPMIFAWRCSSRQDVEDLVQRGLGSRALSARRLGRRLVSRDAGQHDGWPVGKFSDKRQSAAHRFDRLP
jgi:hypothetical protein